VLRHSEQAAEKSQQQIPHRLNFAPTSAKTALVGGPGSPVRDDNIKGLVTAHLKVCPSKIAVNLPNVVPHFTFLRSHRNAVWSRFYVM
jgi:hypothetical protein